MEKPVVKTEYWDKKRTVETGLVYGQYRVKEYDFDHVKTVKVISVSFVVFLYAGVIDPAIVLLMMLPIFFFVGGTIIVTVGLLQGYMAREYINGKIYRYWLSDSHNQVYRIVILVSEWKNFTQTDNVISFFGRRLQRYGNRLTGTIHCPWITQPKAWIEDKDLMRKGFEEFKVRYNQPLLTGKILEMSYYGQELKKERYFE